MWLKSLTVGIVCTLSAIVQVRSCGDGESLTFADTYTCCTNGKVNLFEYTTNGGTHEDAIQVYVNQYDDRSTYYKDSVCDIAYMGESCSGPACDSASDNDCSVRISLTTPTRVCAYFKCNNNFAQCNVDDFAFTGSLITDPSPPPPSPPPQVPATIPASSSPTYSTSENCQCVCCKGAFCDAKLVASYDAASSAVCDSDYCRSTFSAVCPAKGENGSVRVSYSAKSAPQSSSANAYPAPASQSSSVSVYRVSLTAVFTFVVLVVLIA